MRVTYICGITGLQVEGDSKQLPDGWMLPKQDVSLDIFKDPPPKYSVLAISSESLWSKFLADRLKKRLEQ